jgi:hypothetical protein
LEGLATRIQQLARDSNNRFFAADREQLENLTRPFSGETHTPASLRTPQAARDALVTTRTVLAGIYTSLADDIDNPESRTVTDVSGARSEIFQIESLLSELTAAVNIFNRNLNSDNGVFEDARQARWEAQRAWEAEAQRAWEAAGNSGAVPSITSTAPRVGDN